MKSKSKKTAAEIKKTQKVQAALESQIKKLEKNTVALEDEMHKSERKIHQAEKTLGLRK